MTLNILNMFLTNHNSDVENTSVLYAIHMWKVLFQNAVRIASDTEVLRFTEKSIFV